MNWNKDVFRHRTVLGELTEFWIVIGPATKISATGLGEGKLCRVGASRFTFRRASEIWVRLYFGLLVLGLSRAVTYPKNVQQISVVTYTEPLSKMYC